MFRHLRFLAPLVALVAFFGGNVWASEPAPARTFDKYLRIAAPSHEHLPSWFETSIVKFRSLNRPDLEVDLVGVVHIGAEDYYKKIERRLKKYDAVLYEWIGPKDSRPKIVYAPLAEAVGLSSQTKVMNYDHPNFVHADMTEEQLLRALGLGDKKPPEKDDAMDELALVLKRKGTTVARWEIARELTGSTPFHDHPIIIGERNLEALRVMEREIAKGKKKIAIFYGCLHNPDFERHLTERYGMRHVSTEWFSAWDMESTTLVHAAARVRD